MWRRRLLLVLVLTAAFAAMAALMSLAYSGSWAVPVAMWLGVACFFLAWRSVPHGVRAGERPAMRTSAVWVVLGVLAFFVVPVVLFRLSF